LSQFITSNVPQHTSNVPKNTSKSIPINVLQNLSFVKTQSQTPAKAQTPKLQTITFTAAQAALNQTAKSVRVESKPEQLSLGSLNIKNNIIPPGYQLVNIKGNTGNQIITALPPSANKLTSRPVPTTQTQSVTSIQALLQAVQRNVSPKTTLPSPNFIPKQNIASQSGVKLAQSQISTLSYQPGVPVQQMLTKQRVPTQTVLNKPEISAQQIYTMGPNASVDGRGKMTLAQQMVGQRLVNMQTKGGSVAPVKISLPTALLNTSANIINTQAIRYNMTSQSARLTTPQVLRHNSPNLLRSTSMQSLRNNSPQVLHSNLLQNLPISVPSKNVTVSTQSQPTDVGTPK